MINDDIRKLLGGYATNTLTENERKALFEAALEDQELFNALQEEQALKDLLADPVSRAQLQRALETKPAAKMRLWAWSGAVAAIAAAVLIVAVVRNQKPENLAVNYSNPMASREVAPTPAPPQAELKAPAPSPRGGQKIRRAPSDTFTPPAPAAPAPAVSLSARKDEKAADSVAVESPAPPIQNAAVPNQQTTSGAPAGGPSQAVAVQQAQNFREQAASTISINAALAKQDGFLNYSLAKRDANGTFLPLPPGAPLNVGDAVQLRIVPVVSGNLSLYQIDASGQLKRIFPVTAPGLPVTALANYTIPDSPILVAGNEQRFRLMLSPVQAQAPALLDGGLRAKKKSTQGQAAEPAAPARAAAALARPSPTFVDITIAPAKPR